MNLIDAYLNQTATLNSAGELNEYGEPTTTTTTIKCRFEYNRKLVRDKTGNEVVSEANVWTKETVGMNDSITYDDRNWPVVSVSKCIDLAGQFSHYEVRL